MAFPSLPDWFVKIGIFAGCVFVVAGIALPFLPSWLYRPNPAPVLALVVGAMLLGTGWILASFQRQVDLAGDPVASTRPEGSSSTTEDAELSAGHSFTHELSPIQDSEYRGLVAETLRAVAPDADIHVGGTKVGPDGERRLDISIRAVIKGSQALTIFDVLYLPSGEPAGVEAVDIIDSKRDDLGAQFAYIFSNTGFDETAKKKASRIKVGLLSVLRQGDVRAVIEEEVHLRRVTVTELQYSFDPADEVDRLAIERWLKEPTRENLNRLTYEDKPIVGWLRSQASLIIMFNPKVAEKLKSTYNFRDVTQFDLNGEPVALKSISIIFKPNVEWLSQTVTLEAKNGIYDYTRGRVRLAPDSNYVIRGINFSEATPLAEPPDVLLPWVGLIPGEVGSALMVINGLNLVDAGELPDIESLIRPEDLTLTIPEKAKEANVDRKVP